MRVRRRTVSPRREPAAARGFWAEAMAVVLMTVALLLITSLVSYHADDQVQPDPHDSRANPLRSEPAMQALGPWTPPAGFEPAT